MGGLAYLEPAPVALVSLRYLSLLVSKTQILPSRVPSLLANWLGFENMLDRLDPRERYRL